MVAENESFRGLGWLRFWFEPWIETDQSWVAENVDSSTIKLWSNVDTEAKREAYRVWCKYFELTPHWDNNSDPVHCQLITSPARTLTQVAELLGSVSGSRMSRASRSGLTASSNQYTNIENLRWAKQFALACPLPNISSDERLAEAPSAAAGLAVMRSVLDQTCPTAWSRLRMRFPKEIANCVESATSTTTEEDAPNDAALRRTIRFWKAATRRIEAPPETASENNRITEEA